MRMEKRSNLPLYEDMRRIDETETCFSTFNREETKNYEKRK